MELKSLCEELQDVRADSFNRTFMELKYESKSINKHLNNSFNRTFMELKLIEPYRV